MWGFMIELLFIKFNLIGFGWKSLERNEYEIC